MQDWHIEIINELRQQVARRLENITWAEETQREEGLQLVDLQTIAQHEHAQTCILLHTLLQEVLQELQTRDPLEAIRRECLSTNRLSSGYLNHFLSVLPPEAIRGLLAVLLLLLILQHL